jgi:hypothetical protein
MMIVSEEDCDRAVDFIRDHAPIVAKARGELSYVEAYGKSLKAVIMKHSDEKSAAAQEREAYASPQWVEHCGNLRDATVAFELARGLVDAAKMRIDVWRSESANNRKNF